MSPTPGGDLHYHLSQHGVFSEKEMRFYATEIILGLEHMHTRFVVYRDLKVRPCGGLPALRTFPRLVTPSHFPYLSPREPVIRVRSVSLNSVLGAHVCPRGSCHLGARDRAWGAAPTLIQDV